MKISCAIFECLSALFFNELLVMRDLVTFRLACRLYSVHVHVGNHNNVI